jgi:tetratricopeptide (TPR) repeat protein
VEPFVVGTTLHDRCEPIGPELNPLRVLVQGTKMARCWGIKSNLHRCHRERNWKLFCKDHKRQPFVWLFTILFTVVPGFMAYHSYIKPTSPSLESQSELRGQSVQKATLTGFEQELKEAAAEYESGAKDFFKVAERDMTAQRYPDAVTNYQKSLNFLPTMSGYLNLGIALGYTSKFREAEEKFITGLQMARKKGRKEFEAAFLNNLGNIHENLGKFEEALRAYHGALELDRQLGNTQRQANILNNIGNVYRAQGRREETLNTYQAALALSIQKGNLLSQADALNSFGNFFLEQGQAEQALTSYQQALELYQQLGNLLGQANTRVNLGNLYANQRKLEQALTSYQQAL